MNSEDKYIENILTDPEYWLGYRLFQASYEDIYVRFFICFSAEQFVDDECFFIKNLSQTVTRDPKKLEIPIKFQDKLQAINQICDKQEFDLYEAVKETNIEINGIMIQLLDDHLDPLCPTSPEELLEDYIII